MFWLDLKQKCNQKSWYQFVMEVAREHMDTILKQVQMKLMKKKTQINWLHLNKRFAATSNVVHWNAIWFKWSSIKQSFLGYYVNPF